jgi:hypothetical protein
MDGEEPGRWLVEDDEHAALASGTGSDSDSNRVDGAALWWRAEHDREEMTWESPYWPSTDIPRLAPELVGSRLSAVWEWSRQLLLLAWPRALDSPVVRLIGALHDRLDGTAQQALADCVRALEMREWCHRLAEAIRAGAHDPMAVRERSDLRGVPKVPSAALESPELLMGLPPASLLRVKRSGLLKLSPQLLEHALECSKFIRSLCVKRMSEATDVATVHRWGALDLLSASLVHAHPRHAASHPREHGVEDALLYQVAGSFELWLSDTLTAELLHPCVEALLDWTSFAGGDTTLNSLLQPSADTELPVDRNLFGLVSDQPGLDPRGAVRLGAGALWMARVINHTLPPLHSVEHGYSLRRESKRPARCLLELCAWWKLGRSLLANTVGVTAASRTSAQALTALTLRCHAHSSEQLFQEYSPTVVCGWRAGLHVLRRGLSLAYAVGSQPERVVADLFVGRALFFKPVSCVTDEIVAVRRAIVHFRRAFVKAKGANVKELVPARLFRLSTLHLAAARRYLIDSYQRLTAVLRVVQPDSCSLAEKRASRHARLLWRDSLYALRVLEPFSTQRLTVLPMDPEEPHPEKDAIAFENAALRRSQRMLATCVHSQSLSDQLRTHLFREHSREEDHIFALITICRIGAALFWDSGHHRALLGSRGVMAFANSPLTVPSLSLFPLSCVASVRFPPPDVDCDVPQSTPEGVSSEPPFVCFDSAGLDQRGWAEEGGSLAVALRHLWMAPVPPVSLTDWATASDLLVRKLSTAPEEPRLFDAIESQARALQCQAVAVAVTFGGSVLCSSSSAEGRRVGSEIERLGSLSLSLFKRRIKSPVSSRRRLAQVMQAVEKCRLLRLRRNDNRLPNVEDDESTLNLSSWAEGALSLVISAASSSPETADASDLLPFAFAGFRPGASLLDPVPSFQRVFETDPFAPPLSEEDSPAEDVSPPPSMAAPLPPVEALPPPPTRRFTGLVPTPVVVNARSIMVVVDSERLYDEHSPMTVADLIGQVREAASSTQLSRVKAEASRASALDDWLASVLGFVVTRGTGSSAAKVFQSALGVADVTALTLGGAELSGETLVSRVIGAVDPLTGRPIPLVAVGGDPRPPSRAGALKLAQILWEEPALEPCVRTAHILDSPRDAAPSSFSWTSPEGSRVVSTLSTNGEAGSFHWRIVVAGTEPPELPPLLDVGTTSVVEFLLIGATEAPPSEAAAKTFHSIVKCVCIALAMDPVERLEVRVRSSGSTWYSDALVVDSDDLPVQHPLDPVAGYEDLPLLDAQVLASITLLALATGRGDSRRSLSLALHSWVATPQTLTMTLQALRQSPKLELTLIMEDIATHWIQSPSTPRALVHQLGVPLETRDSSRGEEDPLRLVGEVMMTPGNRVEVRRCRGVGLWGWAVLKLCARQPGASVSLREEDERLIPERLRLPSDGARVERQLLSAWRIVREVAQRHVGDMFTQPSWAGPDIVARKIMFSELDELSTSDWDPHVVLTVASLLPGEMCASRIERG